MNKNLVIALLSGLLVGQYSMSFANPPSIQNVKATPPPPALTKQDLIEAAALTGILANEHHDPLGGYGMFRLFRGPRDFVSAAEEYSALVK